MEVAGILVAVFVGAGVAVSVDVELGGIYRVTVAVRVAVAVLVGDCVSVGARLVWVGVKTMSCVTRGALVTVGVAVGCRLFAQ